MSITEVDNLPFDLYLMFLRDATVWNLSQTEDGQEYLYNAWRIQQSAPDRNAIKEYNSQKAGEKNGSK